MKKTQCYCVFKWTLTFERKCKAPLEQQVKCLVYWETRIHNKYKCWTVTSQSYNIILPGMIVFLLFFSPDGYGIKITITFIGCVVSWLATLGFSPKPVFFFFNDNVFLLVFHRLPKFYNRSETQSDANTWANMMFMCAQDVLRPVANLLGALHGVARVDDVIGLERHHGLHLQQRGVDERVVHALASSARDGSASSVTNTMRTVCEQWRHWFRGRCGLQCPCCHFAVGHEWIM